MLPSEQKVGAQVLTWDRAVSKQAGQGRAACSISIVQ